jgi:hypothetical protein
MNLDPLLMRLAIYGPVLIVWTVGIALAWATRRRHPQVSLLAGVAFALQILQTLCGTLAFYWVTTHGAYSGSIFNVLAFVQMGISATAWALILIALFRWRYPPRRMVGYDGQYLPEDFATEVTERR